MGQSSTQDIVQIPGHFPVTVDHSRDDLLTDFGKSTLTDRYLLPGESYQDLFGRVASYYGADQGHAQRIYDYISRHWFMPATPILSNGGTSRGLPISCFLNEAEDSLEGIVGLWNENVWLASKGGGIGCVDSETEFLTQNGWVKMNEYKEGVQIAVVNADGNSGFFENPSKYIEGKAGKMYRISNTISDMVVSDNHRNFVRFDGKSKFSCKETNFIVTRGNIKSARFKPATVVESDTRLPYTDEELRFIVAVAADSHYIEKRDTLRFGLRRQRKIDRLTALSDSLGLNYEVRKEGETTVFLYPSVGLRKLPLTFANFGKASKEQCAVIYKELGYWDGSFDNRTHHLQFSTSKHEETDFIQYVIMIATNKRTSIRSKRKGEYVVSETGEVNTTANDIQEFTPADGKQYCFTTSTGLWLARRNGFIFVTGNSYWGNLRSIGESIGRNGKTSGVIPFIRVMDSLTMAIAQGSLRRGSAAVYLPVWHPEVEEFIDMRRPQGGDPNRKALNLHHGVLVTDAFMRAVEADEEWSLLSPADKSIVRKVSARGLWIRILEARMAQGEPYIVYDDTVRRNRPEIYKKLGHEVKTSNLCSEIALTTGRDFQGKDRTAVCCLSSLNLENWSEWKDDPRFIEDVMLFLDNVLQDFIDRAPDTMAKAKYAALRERSVGLGVMGFHSFLQDRMIPFESYEAKKWNKRIFKHIRARADSASRSLASLRGPCPDALAAGVHERFTHKIAIAPTASISVITGSTSPGIEPISANVFLQKTLSGSFTVRNRHLKELLAEIGQDTDEVWSDITLSKGSVQHLGFLTQKEKDVFKTAFELDQAWIIDMAADRTPFVDQSQSVNLFLPADVPKKTLHNLHFQAWKKGTKSLYYCRSLSILRADTVSRAVGVAADNVPPETNPNNGATCEACQ